MSDNVAGFTNTSKINQEAAEWILLIEDSPQLNKKQIAELNAWVAISDVHKSCITNMANSWGEMDLLSSAMLPLEMKSHSKATNFLVNLFLPLTILFAFFTTTIKRSAVLFRPAFAVPLALCAAVWFSSSLWQPNNPALVFSTTMGQQTSHTMADGSILWLNSSTKVKVDYSENYRRINLIQGEAHFDVAKDASRPFEVYANDRLIRAIGTAFSVHILKNNIEVVVTEGVVELAIVDSDLVLVPENYDGIKIAGTANNSAQKNTSNASIDTVVHPINVKKMLGQLVAGQRIIIPTINETLDDIVELDASEISRHISWKEGKLVFAGESLEEVIAEITRHTDVKIDILDPKLKSMRIGGQFQVGETDTLFYVLESGFGITVNKLTDTHVQLLVKGITN